MGPVSRYRRCAETDGTALLRFRQNPTAVAHKARPAPRLGTPRAEARDERQTSRPRGTWNLGRKACRLGKTGRFATAGRFGGKKSVCSEPLLRAPFRLCDVCPVQGFGAFSGPARNSEKRVFLPARARRNRGVCHISAPRDKTRPFSEHRGRSTLKFSKRRGCPQDQTLQSRKRPADSFFRSAALPTTQGKRSCASPPQ